jgi:hypothetical protein
MQIPARQTILRVLEVRGNGSLLLQGRCGCTIINNVVNLAPCHLPNINGTLHPEMARPSKDYACERCNMPDDEGLMLLCDSCGQAWHTYCLSPALEALPAGIWICPGCLTAGVTNQMVKKTRAGRIVGIQKDTDRLFADAATRARIERHKMYDGRLVVKKANSRKGTTEAVWGVAAYRGADVKPAYLVTYDDNTEEQLSLTALKGRHPLPEGSRRPTKDGDLCSCINHWGYHSPAHYFA